MNAQELFAKWKAFVERMNSQGIPLPMARDPQTGKGSVSLTMVQVSFGLMAATTLLAAGMAINQFGKFFDANDASALAALKESFYMALQMSGLSVGLYYGRKFQRDDKGVSVEGENK